MSKNVTAIYACGGGGIDLTADLVPYTDIPGMSDTVIYRVDTSVSNLLDKPGILPSTQYLIEGADGSGLLRSVNYKPVLTASDQILAKFKPQKTNIFVFTLSGGSGSVIAPVLMGELLRRGERVIALGVATYDSMKHATNCKDTVDSMDGISQRHKLPLVFTPFLVDQHSDWQTVSKDIKGTLGSLLTLFNDNNTKLDSKDIENFLNYTKVSTAAPGLVALEIFNDAEVNELQGTAPIAMATLWPNDERHHLSIMPSYYVNGTAEVCDKMITKPLHFVIDGRPIREFYTSTAENVKRISEDDNRRDKVQAFADKGDLDDYGMKI